MRYIQTWITYGTRRVIACATIAVLLISALPAASVGAQASVAEERLFGSAAQEFGVPKQLLMAISYNESRWQSRGATPSIDGGYGLMDLTTNAPTEDGRGTGRLPARATTAGHDSTLDIAARLLGVTPDTLKSDDHQNIRGGAAVLAQYARQLHGGQLPSSLADWYDVTAKYSGATSAEGAQRFADDIFAVLTQGASVATAQGELRLEATPNLISPTEGVQKLSLPSQQQGARQTSGAQCPTGLNCRFIPAGYAQNSADPADYGNYDHANRPQDMKIKYIVIHDTEGSYQSAIDHFQDTSVYVSGHYIIRSSDGAVTQMVRNEDVAWGAGDWYVNMHAINIEHEGFAAQGSTWYTEEMYRASAKLVRSLAQKYDIPLDREHIIGHDDVPTVAPARMALQHWDPGPYWDWNHYMALLHGVNDQAERAKETKSAGSQSTVTILPTFAINQPVISDCSSGSCVTLPAQGSNMVFLHKSPSNTSALLSDIHLHPTNAPGTNHIDDWGTKATTGRRYVVAAQHGNWTGIWYGGTIGWFYNPANKPTAARSTSATITPRAGHGSIPVYGVAYPEAAAYPTDVPVQTLEALYTMPAGQTYVASAEKLPTDYFYDATINYSLPHDHEIIRGQEKFYQITFNKRIAFVKASDVVLRR